MLLKVENHWTLTVNWLQDKFFDFFSILTLKKGAKTGKSQRVLKALIVLIFEKFQLSASQNNLNFVVGALWYVIGIFTIYA